MQIEISSLPVPAIGDHSQIIVQAPPLTASPHGQDTSYVYKYTCFAEGTDGSPHSMAFFSSVSKSAFPAWSFAMFDNSVPSNITWKEQCSAVPQLEHQSRCQNFGSVFGQAQRGNHPRRRMSRNTVSDLSRIEIQILPWLVSQHFGVHELVCPFQIRERWTNPRRQCSPSA